MAQLPPPVLFLDGGARRRDLQGGRAAAPVAADDQRADQDAGRGARRAAVSAPGPHAACSPTSAASSIGTPTEIFTAGSELLETLKGRPSGRAPRLTVGVANAVPKLVVVPTAAAGDRGRGAGAGHLPRRPSRSARRPARDARARRRHQRHARGAARAREGVQPSAGRIGHDVFCRGGCWRAAAAAVSAVAERRADAAADRQHGAAARARAVVRGGGPASRW